MGAPLPWLGDVPVFEKIEAKKVILGSRNFCPIGLACGVDYTVDGLLLSAIAPWSPQSTVYWWNVNDGKLEEQVKVDGSWRDLSHRPNSNELALWKSGDGGWALLDRASGALTHVPHEDVVEDVAFSADGRFAASAGRDNNEVLIWELDTISIIHHFKGHKRSVWTVAFSPDGSFLASGGYDGTIFLWSLATDSQVTKRKCNNVRSLAFSPSGDLLVSGSGNGDVCLWSVPKLKRNHSFQAKHEFDAGGNAGVQWVDFDTQGARVFSLGNENALRCWASTDGSQLWRADVPKSHIRGCATTISSKTASIATGGTFDIVRQWNVEDGSPLRQSVLPPYCCTSISFAPSGKSLATAGSNCLQEWNVQKSEVTFSLPISGFGRADCCYSPDGSWLAVVDYNVVRLIQTTDHSEIASFKIGSYLSGSISLSSDGSFLALPVGNVCEVWDIENRACIHRLAHVETIRASAFGPTSDWLVTASSTLRIWSIDEDATLVQEHAFPSEAQGLAISISGSKIALSVTDRIHILDVQTEEIDSTLAAIPPSLHEPRFLGENRLAVTDSRGCVHLASLPNKCWEEKLDCRLDGKGDIRNSLWPLAISRDARCLAALGVDQNVHLWDVEPGQLNVTPVAIPRADQKEAGKLFETRLFGRCFKIVGKLKGVTTKFADERVRALGGRVSKSVSKKITDLVISSPGHLPHKPTAMEKKVDSLIESGLSIKKLCESEFVALILPLPEEAQQLLRGEVRDGLKIWNSIRSKFAKSSSDFPLNLANLDLSGVDLRGYILESLKLVNANLDKSNLDGVSLFDTVLTGASMVQTSFQNADLYRANLSNGQLNEADFSSANLTWTSLRNASLRKANLSGATLLKTDLRGADLSKANLNGTKITDVQTDVKTVWPQKN